MFYPSAFAFAILFLLAFFGIAVLTIYLLHARSWLRDLEHELERVELEAWSELSRLRDRIRTLEGNDFDEKGATATLKALLS
jgi:hypothetical protein